MAIEEKFKNMDRDYIIQELTLKTSYTVLKDKSPIKYAKEYLGRWINELPDEKFVELFNVELSKGVEKQELFYIAKFKFSNNLAEE